MANESIVLNVTTTDDQNDGSDFEGLSLRDAILIANADPDNHYIINLPAGTYELTILNVLLPTTDTSADAATLFQSRLATGDLDIIGNITIIGEDPNNTIIDAETLRQPLTTPEEPEPPTDPTAPTVPIIELTIGDRVFDVLSAERSGKTLQNGTPANGNLVLKNLTIQGGITDILNIDTVAQGGGLNIEPTTKVEIINSIIRDNRSTDNAAGIYNQGNLTIYGSTITGNLADAAAPDIIEGGGGGILNENGATLIMVNTTVSGNISASDDGNDPPSGPGDGGGGIINRGTARIINSTIVNNFAQVGSGIYSETTGANTILYNTIVANNTGSPDLDGFFDPRSGYNLVSNANGSILDANNGNIVGGFTTPRINVNIGPLQDNGGATPTHALLTGSPAINAGDTENVNILFYFDDPPTDQRGFNRISGSKIDIGAYESSSSPVTINNNPPESIQIDNNPPESIQIDNSNEETFSETPINIPNNDTTQGNVNSETTENSVPTPETPPVENTTNPILDDPLFRFQNSDRPGTYLFAGEAESESIRRNYMPPFIDEGFTFNVSLEAQDGLVRFNRFQSKINPGTFLFANEVESINIRANHSNTFFEEGTAFYAYAADANIGEDVFRYQSKTNPGTYLFVLAEEKSVIDSQFASQFTYEGVAFEVNV